MNQICFFVAIDRANEILNSYFFIFNIEDSAYSARTAHPFQRNGAPFRFKLSKAQQVN